MNERETVNKLFGKAIPSFEELKETAIESYREKMGAAREEAKEIGLEVGEYVKADNAEEAAEEAIHRLSNADILVYDAEYDFLVDVDVELDVDQDFGVINKVCARTVIRMAIQKMVQDHIIEETKDD